MSVFPSPQESRQQRLQGGARDRFSVVGGVFGFSQHRKNIQREFKHLQEQKVSERRRLFEQRRLQAREYKKELKRREKHYQTVYHVHDYKKEEPEYKEAESKAQKYFEREKRARDLHRHREQLKIDHALDTKYKHLRKDAVKRLEEEYKQINDSAQEAVSPTVPFSRPPSSFPSPPQRRAA